MDGRVQREEREGVMGGGKGWVGVVEPPAVVEHLK